MVSLWKLWWLWSIIGILCAGDGTKEAHKKQHENPEKPYEQSKGKKESERNHPQSLPP
jgi:hypothetical protein